MTVNEGPGGTIDNAAPYRTPAEVAPENEPYTRSPVKRLLAIALLGIGLIFMGFLMLRRRPVLVPAKAESVELVDEPVALEDFVSRYGMHRGGAHVLMDDGEVEFVTDATPESDLEGHKSDVSGDKKSPYGLWGTLGTRSADRAENPRD